MRADTKKSRQYFAASNSRGGFVNYFSQIFGDGKCQQLFVIKGGPGTGKSSFMRKMGDLAEQSGYAVTYYFCSSDPTSLDGIMIDVLSVGFVDGTAPHVWEPASVGVFEQIVNLGAFWDRHVLVNNRLEIESLTEKKRERYKQAYRYLSAYGAVRAAADEMIRPLVDAKKLSRAAERIFRRYAPPAAECPVEMVGLCDSVGMAGRVRLDTYEQIAKVFCPIRDVCGTAYLFLSAIHSLCLEAGVSVRVSYDPILPERIDALELIDNGVVFSQCSGEEEGRTINMRRFVDNEGYRATRSAYRENLALCDCLLGLANKAFSEVREYHFQLEKIFGAAMDFEAKERFETAFSQGLFS